MLAVVAPTCHRIFVRSLNEGASIFIVKLGLENLDMIVQANTCVCKDQNELRRPGYACPLQSSKAQVCSKRTKHVTVKPCSTNIQIPYVIGTVQ